MKTVNGKNKLERQINKAKKYFGMELVHDTNKYLEVVNYDVNNTFVIIQSNMLDNFRFVKNGELALIQPLNWKEEKPIFKPNWAVMLIDSYYIHNIHEKIYIFVEKDPHKNKLLKEVAKGCEDVYLLKDFIKLFTPSNKLYLRKK